MTPKQVKKGKDTDCWSHDRFNEMEQAPKSRTELVSAYGYDIRNEDCAPRPRRPRRYGRHQGKYSRNWEDEEAYKKTQATQAKLPSRRPLQPEDFPALGSNKMTNKPRERVRRSSRPQDENDPMLSSNYRSPVRNRDQRPREDRGSRELRGQRYNNDTSNNNNNSRNVKGKKNINFNHNIEFKNQNRKNINYESTQPKNNNVLNQQMQSSTSSSQHGQSSQGGNQQQQQRYNNETPVSSMSFTNSKMNNTTNNSNAPASGSSRTILNFDNSSGNYGRGSREKEVNSQHQHQMHQQQAPAISPNKNLQYTEHQIDQMKLVEKNYQQQQGKATNLNLNQVPQHQQQSMNNMQEVQMMNNSEMTRSKRYSSLRQRSNLNETQQQGVPYHQQYHQQEIEVQNVMPAQPTPAFIPQQAQQPTASMMTPQAVPQTTAQATSVQQQAQNQKYQAAYYAANPANEYAAQQAAMMNAMVEKYQYQQQPPAAQYLPPQQQPQQIYMPTQTQPPPQQQQILNYVSTIQPQAPAAAPTYPQYTNYQNYNIQAPAPTPAPPQPAPQQPPPPSQPIYQTQSGLTYYPNAQIAPAHPQRVIQPQRRPNPIPILAPPDHKKNQSAASADDSDKNADNEKGTSSAENIDHILDNMFVQRQPYEPTISLKDPQSSAVNDERPEEQISESMNVSFIDHD